MRNRTPCSRRTRSAAHPAPSSFIRIPAGIYEIGYEGTGFCFDNELARHKVYIDDFSISGDLVTNEEWLAFIDDGGYTEFRLVARRRLGLGKK